MKLTCWSRIYGLFTAGWVALSFILYIWLWFGWPYRTFEEYGPQNPPDFETLPVQWYVKTSRTVAHGIVVRRQESVLLPVLSRHGEVYTKISVKPFEMLKGDRLSSTIDYWEPDGVCAWGFTSFAGHRPVEVGDEVVTFVGFDGVSQYWNTPRFPENSAIGAEPYKAYIRKTLEEQGGF